MTCLVIAVPVSGVHVEYISVHRCAGVRIFQTFKCLLATVCRPNKPRRDISSASRMGPPTNTAGPRSSCQPIALHSTAPKPHLMHHPFDRRNFHVPPPRQISEPYPTLFTFPTMLGLKSSLPLTNRAYSPRRRAISSRDS
eukprot:scaffold1190_cov393-Prasinococcus_capsulatus_cf.AAC.4